MIGKIDDDSPAALFSSVPLLTLDTDMDSAGIGVADRNGQLFAVEDFCKAK
jgi:hypothetical protein